MSIYLPWHTMSGNTPQVNNAVWNLFIWLLLLLALFMELLTGPQRCGQFVNFHSAQWHISYLSPTYDKCGEICHFSLCGVISNVSSWNMKFLRIWHMCDVENASTYVKFMLFVSKLVLLRFTHFCRKICLSRFTRFCVEKI